jgi:hypothetical protein
MIGRIGDGDETALIRKDHYSLRQGVPYQYWSTSAGNHNLHLLTNRKINRLVWHEDFPVECGIE